MSFAKGTLNRSARRRLKALRNCKSGKRPLLIIDSTLTSRRGKHLENTAFHRLEKKAVRGHKFVNFVLFLDDEVVPLSALAHYSREYCEEHGYTYKTENDLVIEWLNWLHASDLVPREDIKHLHFVCDAGYDAKKVQKPLIVLVVSLLCASRAAGSSMVYRLKNISAGKESFPGSPFGFLLKRTE